MGKSSHFGSAEEAQKVTWRFIRHLADLWLWMLLALAHLALLYLLLFAAWLFQVTPADTVAWLRAVAHSKALSTFLWLGGSLLGAGALYWKAVRWALDASYSGWLFRYLNKGD